MNFARSNRINTVVDYILNDYSFFSTTEQAQSKDNFYYYDQANGFYILDAEMFILDKINEIFPNQFKHYSHIRDVINLIQKFSPIIPQDQIDTPHIQNWINGLYDKNTNSLIRHTPRIYTTKQINQKYVPDSNSNSLSKHAERLALLNMID